MMHPWLKGSRCLVTGGAGFIGSHICERLIEQGAQVTALDDLSSGKAENLKGLKVELVRGSVTDAELVRSSVKRRDYVFHLGAIPAVPRSIERPLETAWANLWGTQVVLEESRLAGVKRVVLSASSSAYGGISGSGPRAEDLRPVPLSPYAAQKVGAEYLCQAYSAAMGLDTIALRYFNIFGPKQDPNSPYSAVIPKFIRHVLNGEKIQIYGDGNQSRDFTYVDNAVLANLLATRPDRKMGGEVVNVGCGESFSLNTLVDEVFRIAGKEVALEKTAPRAGDVLFSLANIDRARELLGYEPQIDFHTGLKKLYQVIASE